MKYRFIGLALLYSFFGASLLLNSSGALFTDSASASNNTFSTAESFGEEGSTEGSLVINEFLPNPSGPSTEDTEWIELYNGTSTMIDISNWKLDDVASGGTTPYTIPSGTTIASNGFLVFEKSATNVGLNNENDTVRLLNPSDLEIDTHSYTTTVDDISLGRDSDGTGSWKSCTSSTKGSSNNSSC